MVVLRSVGAVQVELIGRETACMKCGMRAQNGASPRMTSGSAKVVLLIEVRYR
jgi:hypothetical protein